MQVGNKLYRQHEDILIIQALTSISREHNHTVIFPLPIDLMEKIARD
jgi:hypothetical protein